MLPDGSRFDQNLTEMTNGRLGLKSAEVAQYQQEEAVREYLAASSIPWSPGYQ